MELGCCSSGSITAIAGSPLSISLDSVGPMGSQDDGSRRGCNGISVHLELVEVVQLFELPFLPLFPGVKGLEFAPSECAKLVRNKL